MKRIITTALLGALMVTTVPMQAGVKEVMKTSLEKAQTLVSKAIAGVKQHPYITALIATALVGAAAFKYRAKTKERKEKAELRRQRPSHKSIDRWTDLMATADKNNGSDTDVEISEA